MVYKIAGFIYLLKCWLVVIQGKVPFTLMLNSFIQTFKGIYGKSTCLHGIKERWVMLFFFHILNHWWILNLVVAVEALINDHHECQGCPTLLFTVNHQYNFLSTSFIIKKVNFAAGTEFHIHKNWLTGC